MTPPPLALAPRPRGAPPLALDWSMHMSEPAHSRVSTVRSGPQVSRMRIPARAEGPRSMAITCMALLAPAPAASDMPPIGDHACGHQADWKTALQLPSWGAASMWRRRVMPEGPAPVAASGRPAHMPGWVLGGRGEGYAVGRADGCAEGAPLSEALQRAAAFALQAGGPVHTNREGRESLARLTPASTSATESAPPASAARKKRCVEPSAAAP